MPTIPLKKLHFADSIEELQNKANLNKLPLADKQTSKLCKSAEKLLKEAKKQYNNKDEELAYVYYFKFVDLILILKERDDVSKEPIWIAISKFTSEAIDIAKDLKSSLIRRYSDKYEAQNRLAITPKPVPPKDELGDSNHVNSAPVENKITVSHNLDAVTPAELLNLMKEKKVIVMDTRSTEDFEESHIKHSCCISVPLEVLAPGTTSVVLEKILPYSSKAKWAERGNADYIILMDWDTDNIPAPKGSALFILEEAITKWDLYTPLKQPPLILIGGYKEWILRYPMYCTKALDIFSLDKNDTCHVTDISDIDYPDFDENDVIVDKNKKNVASDDVNSMAPLFSRHTKPREQMKNVFTKITNLDPSIRLNDKPKSNIDISSIKSFLPAVVNHPEETTKPIPNFDRSLKPLKTTNKSLPGHSETLFQSPQFISNTLKDSELPHKEFKNEKNLNELKKEEPSLHDVKPSKLENSEINVRPNTVNKEMFMEDVSRNEPKPLGNEKLFGHKFNEQYNESNKTFNSKSSVKESYRSDTYVVPLKEEGGGGGSRGLTRSYSSPNIAELVPSISEIKRPLPSIDRSTKPKIERAFPPFNDGHIVVRNFNPTYGHCPVRPVTGLRNLGNTCYMNAIVQCLSNTEQLSAYFINEQYKHHLRREKPSYGEVAEEFGGVIRALWMGTFKSIAPRDLKNCLARFISLCAGNEQQDSHEFLMLLIDKLHNDLNQGQEPEPLPDLDSLPVSVATEKFWNHYRLKNRSKISEIFEGLLKSTLTCLSCARTSTSYEVFPCLSLPISSKRNIKECLEGFLKSEKMSGEGAWFCPNCKQKKEAEKVLTICKFPMVLIIQLKRFSYIGMWKEKLQTTIKYQSTLDIQGKSYDLHGIVNHVGCLEGGHYTACCKNPSSGDWYKYDDHEASKILFSDIPISAAYMFFYTSRDVKNR